MFSLSRKEDRSAQTQKKHSPRNPLLIYPFVVVLAVFAAQFFLRFLPNGYHFFSQFLCTTQHQSEGSLRTAMTGPYDQFILFGDSITQQSCNQDQGFALTPALQDVYIRRLDVINRGFSGYNTSQALEALPIFMPTLAQAKVRFMAIFFGANDACLPDFGHKTITIQQPRMILITPPPVDEYRLEEPAPSNGVPERQRTAEHTKQYADACHEVGAELGVVVLDLWSTFMAEAGWKEGDPLPGSKKTERNSVLGELLRDGIHLRNK